MQKTTQFFLVASLKVCLLNNKQTGRLAIYFVSSQNQIPQNLGCLLSQRKIACRVEIWEQIVFIGHSDKKHNIARASKEMLSNRKEM